MAGDHFYTLDPAGELAPAGGYEREGTACHVFPAPQPGTVPFFRWYSPTSGDHFYTTDPNGELAPQAGYVHEGVACHVFSSAQANTVQLFRWYSPNTADHFYTLDPAGELAPQSGYNSEGVACHVFAAQQPNTADLFRWFQSGFMSNYTFDSNITNAQRLTILERHSFGHFRAKSCANLSAQERAALLGVYGAAIQHGIDTSANANASAIVGGTQIFINFGNLFPLGAREIAQTLIHELMHCAGHTHPTRCDPGTGCSPVDVPGDNGAYYGSPPLRAELCIAGVQSDAGHIALFRGRNITDRTRTSFQPLSCPVHT